MEPQKVTLDLDKLNAMYGEDPSFKAIVFEGFLQEIEPQFEEFKTLVNAQDWEEVGKAAHSLKPTFAMVGLPDTEAQLKAIELAAKSPSGNGLVASMSKQFINLFPHLLEAVKNEMASMQ